MYRIIKVEDEEIIEGEIVGEEKKKKEPDKFIGGCKTSDEEVGYIEGLIRAIFGKDE